jgi:hypothetical protein
MKSMASGELALQLALFRRRGPWPGAGRPPGPNPRVRHESRPDSRGRFPGHVTLKVRRGLRTLRDVRIVRALEATLAAGPWFEGWREGVVALMRSPAPVARARTWLLRVGWRRHGLLDPSEVPGPRAP